MIALLSVTDAGSLVVIFDAALNATITTSVTTTSYPVEDGSNISDNATDDPDEIQIEALFTNTPASIVEALTAVPTRAEDLYADLILLRDRKDVVTVITATAEYSDMMITRVVRPKNASIGDAAQFTVSLRKIRKVQSTVAEVPLRAKGGKGALSDQGTQPKTPANTGQNSTFLNKTLGFR